MKRNERFLPFSAAGVLLLSTGAFAQCELDKLTASDGAPFDSFGAGAIFGDLTTLAGHAVAVEGDTILVGAPWHDDVAATAGAVYVFEKSGDAWVETDKLLASDAAELDSFGFAVALDGDVAVVSALFKDVGGVQQGAAYVFERSAAGWLEADRLTASDGAAYDWFGTAVDVSGERVLVGALNHDDSGLSSGAAYVFERGAAGWTETAELLATGGAAGDGFGVSVGLESDTAVVGAYRHPSVGFRSGAVYVFSFSQGAWTQVQELVPLDALAGDQFGVSVAIDRGRILAGSRFEDPLVASPGVAYVFEPVAGGWVQDAQLSPSDGVFGDWFGFTLALDGDRALVSSHRAFTVDWWAGAAYVFERGATGWTESEKLVASDTSANDFFGMAVALDSESLVVGAPFHDDLGQDSGAAYAFASLCPVGTVYCSPAIPNTTGLPGTIVASGSEVVMENDLTLVADQLPPGQFGYFLTSQTQGFFMPPGSDGFICLGGDIGRYNGDVGQGPTFSLQIDLMNMPVNPPQAVAPGDTWNFQAWYRDVGNTNNFTDAVSITFQ